MIKEPYFTDEERKQVWVREEDYFRFETRRDLSGGIDVYPVSRAFPPTLWDSTLAQEISCFIAHFMLFHYPRLNGFSGMDCVNYRIHKEPK